MSLFSSDRVLVPIDFSEEAFQALQDTLEFVEDASHLYILHVLHHLEPTEPGVVWQTLDEQTRRQNVKKAFYEHCSAPEYQEAQFDIAIGNPGAEILDYAKTHNIDLIVIPSHGRTGVGRFFLGSIAERIVRYAHCPVLVLRR
jgi:nucleotide-binding universal stress UspA family protein